MDYNETFFGKKARRPFFEDVPVGSGSPERSSDQGGLMDYPPENQSKTPWFDRYMLNQLLTQIGDQHLSDVGRPSPADKMAEAAVIR